MRTYYVEVDGYYPRKIDAESDRDAIRLYCEAVERLHGIRVDVTRGLRLSPTVRLYLGDAVEVWTGAEWEAGYTLQSVTESGGKLYYRCTKPGWVTLIATMDTIRRAEQPCCVC